MQSNNKLHLEEFTYGRFLLDFFLGRNQILFGASKPEFSLGSAQTGS